MSGISERLIDQAYSDLKDTCGGVRNDYFGLLYVEREFHVPRDKAINQVAFGGNDYGIDGFHLDTQRRNLYLFQFKYSTSYTQFKQSLQRLIDAGMERIFMTPNLDASKNQVLLQLRSCMVENRAIIDQICVRFVFTGDPAEAERSQVLDKLREDLENKKYLIDEFFGGRQVTLVVEFRSATGKVGAVVDQRRTRVFRLPISELLARSGPHDESMQVGFVRLVDLHEMFREMGPRFFERNIRYGLGGSEFVNRAISRALKQIVLDGKESPAVFAFNHNGITLFAEKLESKDGCCHITEPRLLNGAQTITTFRDFLEKNADNKHLDQRRSAVQELRVLCKIITQATQGFVTAVTINNNRQNPVEPWDLHANDLIQLELQDKFRDDLGIYYERQENAFQNLSYQEMEEEGITEEGKAIELVRLAQTLLVSDGNISALANLRRVFEDDAAYDQVFTPGRLKADTRLIVLCYKIQFRLRRLLQEIEQKGPNKYWFIFRARQLFWALLCQALLNDADIQRHAEQYGSDMSIKAQYTDLLASLASTRCRPILADLLKDKAYVDKVAEQNFGFLRTNAAYKRSMEFAYKRWKWVEKKLK
ncbi:MAG: AIPR family protein [Acidobacteria bacterium]|nr:AIPR family protein [Acidobacteriota bacterium]